VTAALVDRLAYEVKGHRLPKLSRISYTQKSAYRGRAPEVLLRFINAPTLGIIENPRPMSRRLAYSNF
jgi:hypothetical protein